LDEFDHVDHGARINPSLTANDAMSQNSKVLIVFVEEDDDPFFGLEIVGDEYGNMWRCLWSA
jgi:hypothetical protein